MDDCFAEFSQRYFAKVNKYKVMSENTQNCYSPAIVLYTATLLS